MEGHGIRIMAKVFGGMMNMAVGGLDMIVKKDHMRGMDILSMMSYAHTRLQSGMENCGMEKKKVLRMLETHYP